MHIAQLHWEITLESLALRLKLFWKLLWEATVFKHLIENPYNFVTFSISNYKRADRYNSVIFVNFDYQVEM